MELLYFSRIISSIVLDISIELSIYHTIVHCRTDSWKDRLQKNMPLFKIYSRRFTGKTLKLIQLATVYRWFMYESVGSVYGSFRKIV